MKEWIYKVGSGEYILTTDPEVVNLASDAVEVPEGSDFAMWYGAELNHIAFYKKFDDGLFVISPNYKTWTETLYKSIDQIFIENEEIGHVAWEREKELIIDKLVLDEVKHGVDATLAERQSQYGCFEDVAFVTENIMSILSKVRSNGLQDLPHSHRMALYMIASKMARIVNGDFNHKDSWHDIGGYSKLIENLIGDSNEI